MRQAAEGRDPFHPEHLSAGVREQSEPGAFLPGDVGVNPEVGDLLGPPASGTEPIAGPVAAQRPGTALAVDVDLHSFAGGRGHLEHPRVPHVTARRRDRHLAGRSRCRARALELHHRPAAGNVEGAFAALEEAQDRFQVLPFRLESLARSLRGARRAAAARDGGRGQPWRAR